MMILQSEEIKVTKLLSLVKCLCKISVGCSPFFSMIPCCSPLIIIIDLMLNKNFSNDKLISNLDKGSSNILKLSVKLQK